MISFSNYFFSVIFTGELSWHPTLDGIANVLLRANNYSEREYNGTGVVIVQFIHKIIVNSWMKAL